MTTRTVNYKFELIDFDTHPWQGKEHDNWRQLDAVLATLTTIVNIVGVWHTATAYEVDDRLVDGNTGTVWTCLVDHTSASTGTFAQDRAARPTYWESFTVAQTFRGTWVTGTAYAVNDFVVSGNIYAVCTTANTAGATFAGDAAYWTYLANLTADVAAAAASATAAAASAASINMPTMVGESLNMLRANVGETAFEYQTPAQVLSNIGAQPLDATLTALAGVTVAADKIIYATAADTFTTADFTATGRFIVAAATAAAARIVLGVVIGTDVQAYDADTLKADVADILTAGFAGTPYNAGTKSSGTYTPDEANGNLQYAVNGGAHTLAPPTNNCTIVIQYTNDGSAGAITTSGFTVVTGDSLTTTNADDFFCYITKNNSKSQLHITALQ